MTTSLLRFTTSNHICACADIFLTLAGNAMPQSSAFFLNYIIIQGFFVALFRIFFPHPGVLIAIFRIFGCCSARISELPPPPCHHV